MNGTFEMLRSSPPFGPQRGQCSSSSARNTEAAHLFLSSQILLGEILSMKKSAIEATVTVIF
jgi:hypothetical protein